MRQQVLMVQFVVFAAHIIVNNGLEFLPSIKTVIINVGCNLDPPRPPSNDESIAVIAVEPVLSTAKRIVPHPRLYIVTAAISDFEGFAMLNVYNHNGLSSSLSKPSTDGDKAWNGTWLIHKTGSSEPKVMVSVLTLKTLLKSIPLNIKIQYLKTDMQGHDLRAIKSAGRVLRRISKITTECYCGEQQTYAGAHNHLHTDFLPYMSALGYKLVNSPCSDGSSKEADAEWTLTKQHGL